MITQPDFDEAQLKLRIEEEYGFAVLELRAVPWGETSWGYAVEELGGQKYFAKVYPAAEVPEAPLALTNRLYADCHLENIVHPIVTRDKRLKTSFAGHALVLFNHVEGGNQRDHKLTVEEFRVLGRVLAKLHNATPQVSDYAEKEHYETPFVRTYEKVLKEIAKEPGRGNEPQKELKKLLLPHLSRLEREVYSLENDRLKAQAVKPKFVICHGDLTSSNILVTPGHDLYLADWDAPLLAPKERDLVFLTGPKMMFVMQGYRTIIDQGDVDDKVIAYYQHWRNVRDIAAYGNRILHTRQDEDQSWHDLDELVLLLGEMGLWKGKEMKKR